jgi:hypothetical protein
MINRWLKTVMSLEFWQGRQRAALSGNPAQMTLIWMIALGFAAMLMLMAGLTLAVWLALGSGQPQDGLLVWLGVLAVSGLVTPPLLAWALIRRVQRLGADAASQLNESLAESLVTDEAASESPTDLPQPAAAFEDLPDVIRRLHGLDEPAGHPVAGAGTEPPAALTQLVRRCLELSTEIATHQGREAQSRQRMAQSIDRIEGLTFQTVSLALQSGLQGPIRTVSGRGGDMAADQGIAPDEVRQLARRALEAARDIQRMVDASDAPGAAMGERLRLAIEMDRLLELMTQTVDERLLQRLEILSRQLSQQAVQAGQVAAQHEQQSERLDKVISAFELLVQTQQAAWQTRHLLATVRDRARDCG